jgi:hypothetical protein
MDQSSSITDHPHCRGQCHPSASGSWGQKGSLGSPPLNVFSKFILKANYGASARSFLQPRHSRFVKFKKIVSVSKFLAECSRGARRRAWKRSGLRRTLNATVAKVDNLVWLPRARKNENWWRGPTVDKFCAGNLCLPSPFVRGSRSYHSVCPNASDHKSVAKVWASALGSTEWSAEKRAVKGSGTREMTSRLLAWMQ